MLGNASGRLGEAWASLGLSQPAERMLLEHFFALLCSSQPASRITGLFYTRSAFGVHSQAGSPGILQKAASQYVSC